MQPTENFSVPRRTLDVEDFIDIVRRHKGWIFGPFLLTLVASVVGVYLWPDKYDSDAVVKIVPQQVPQNMVQSSITNDLSDRINSMAPTILSRNVLTTIINNFDLYKSERNRLPMEDVIELMKKDDSDSAGGVADRATDRRSRFRGHVSYENRLLAQRSCRTWSAGLSTRTSATARMPPPDDPVHQGSARRRQEGAGRR